MPAFTPNLNLYLPGGGSLGIGGEDEAADIDKPNQNFQKIDSWSAGIDSSISDLTSDTGWVDVTLSSGIVAPSPAERLQVKRRGGLVMIKGGVSNTGVSVSSTTIIGNIPTGFRTLQNMFGRCGTSTGASDASVLVIPNGDIQIRTNASLSAYYFPVVPPWTIE